MIVSASRRTDLPAFYSDWFMNRVRAGFCEVPNPVRPDQVARVSLAPEDVEALVFWTRNPRPLMRHLDELDRRGLRFLFLFTLLGHPRALDPHGPSADSAVETFRRLADRLGPARVVWRYDPLVLSQATDPDWHRRQFAHLAGRLRGFTRRCKLSLVDRYAKMAPRMRALEGTPHAFDEGPAPAGLLEDLAGLARENGILLESCAETEDLASRGIPAGRCIDPDLLFEVFGIEVPRRKDPGQRPSCGCAVSRDIGMYDTCRFGCAYCYAVRDFAAARRHHARHDPQGPRLRTP